MSTETRDAEHRPAGDAYAHLVSEFLRSEPGEVSNPLRPIAALREVIAVCESIAGGREAPQPQDRRSLKADVQHALTAMGDELKRELQPALRDYFHGELADLGGLLDQPPGVTRLRAATRTLVERLRRPACAQASWRDLVAEVRGGADEETCRLRALQLREIEESLGHEWLWRARRLGELVREGGLGDCEEVLSHPPSRSAQVAWFIFANADLPDGYLRVGQVQFFSHRLWPEAVTSRDFMSRVPEAEFPGELDQQALDLLNPTDGAVAHVYARVELTGPRAVGERNPWMHGRPPEDWARDLISGIVEAGTFRVGGSAWKLLAGAALYHGQISDESGTFGNWSGSLGFDDPDLLEANRRFTVPLREGTGEALEELEPRFAELLAEGSPASHDALTEVRWYEAARGQGDAAQRVVLHVRAFERALPTGDGLRWSDAVKRYFREFWALDELDNDLFRLAHGAELDLRHHRSQELERLEQWLVRDGERFTISLGAFLRTARSIESLLPPTCRLRRRGVRQAARWAADPAALRAHVTGLEQRFDALLARALRQRNATVHGFKTIPEVVASVEPFVARLAAFVVAQAIHGAATGDDLVEALERGRARSRRTLWRLDQAERPVERVLYGAEDA